MNDTSLIGFCQVQPDLKQSIESDMKGNIVNGIFGTERLKMNRILGVCEAESLLFRTPCRRYVIVQALLCYSFGIYILGRSV